MFLKHIIDFQQVKIIIRNRKVYLRNTFLRKEKKLLRDTHTKSRMLCCANAALKNHFFSGGCGWPVSVISFLSFFRAIGCGEDHVLFAVSRRRVGG